jgi:hypothetical protein
VTGGWRRPRNEELHNFYASPNVVRVFKWRMMRWAEHMECMGGMRSTYKILMGNPEGKIDLWNHSTDLYKSWYTQSTLNVVRRLQFWFISVHCNRYFTWRWNWTDLS